MKRMLINATQPEELRVAIADGQQLFDLDIEVPSQEQKKSNVYKGKITRVEPSLEACFVEFGSTRHGFLPLKEICESLYSKDAIKKGGKVAIRDAVREGQEIIVQVEKEERGNKGAALTTFISLAGRYLVLMPTNPTAGGVSRRITGNDRDHLREQLQKVTSPDNVGIIIRTAGVGRDAEELQWDLDYLLQLWSAIEQAASERTAPFLIHQESNLFIRALRDYLRNDIGEILIDNESVYNDAREFMQQVMPHNLNKLKLYKDQVPLFNRYQIETQIESAFARTVHLPSGGAVVFDHTEALLSIDINSARATKGTDIEDTAYSTNMESAIEIARQLRLRDLGGLIVIDFIDMSSRKHQREVEECLRDAMQIDKARVQIGRISRFGLLEMSRQRLRPSLGESSQETCPRCEGHGTIRSVESLALSILRLVEEEVMKDFTGQMIVQAPVEVINFLHNEKRAALAEVESRHRVPIVMLANQHLVTPHFEILRVKKSDITDEASYARVEQPETKVYAHERSQANVTAVPAPAVTRIVPDRPAPTRTEEKAPGLFARLASMLFSHPKDQESNKPGQPASTANKPGSQNANQQNSPRPPRSAQQQSKRRGGQRQGDRNPKTGGQPRQQQPQQQRTSKKRTSKKTQSKQNQQPKQSQQPGAQTQPDQQKPGQPRTPRGRNRKQQPGPAPSENVQVADSEVVSQTPVQTVAGSGEADGNIRPEQKETTSRRGSRRRRSPYKTGGSKPRSERDESQTDATTDANANQQTSVSDQSPTSDSPKNPAPASASKAEAADAQAVTKELLPIVPDKLELTPTEVTSSESNKTESKSSEPSSSKPRKPRKPRSPRPKSDTPKSTELKPVETKPAEPIKTDAKPADAKLTDAKPAEKAEAPKEVAGDKVKTARTESAAVSNTSDDGGQAAKTTKRPARKKAAGKKTSGKKVSKKTAESAKPDAKPAPSPVIAAEKDSKGIYTLKPPPSE